MKIFYVFLSFTFLLCLFSCRKNSQGELCYAKAENVFQKNNLSEQEREDAYQDFVSAELFFSSEGKYLGAAHFAFYQAVLQNKQGDYYGAELASVKALAFMRKIPKSKQDTTYKKLLFSTYNELAISERKLKNYSKAMEYYEKALPLVIASEQKYSILNNMAALAGDMQDYNRAVDLLQKSQQEIAHSDTIKSKDKLKLEDNIAYYRFLQTPTLDISRELLSVLAKREQLQDEVGINASYSHLSDFYEQKDPSKSLLYAKKFLESSKRINIVDDTLEALKKLIKQTSGSKELTQKYFQEYTTLEESLRTKRTKDKNQFARIRFEAEQKSIDALNKEVENQKTSIYYLVAFVILGTVFFVLFRSRKNQQEKYLKLKIEKEKISNVYSKKVHDEIANGIYQTMTKIENTICSQEEIISRLEDLYQRSRDISKEINNKKNGVCFEKRLRELLDDYQGDKNLILAGMDQVDWGKVEEEFFDDLYPLVRELITNVKKHSKAKLALFQFSSTNDGLQLVCRESGGDAFTKFKASTGIGNMRHRLQNYGGSIRYEPSPSGAVQVVVKMPFLEK